MTVKLFKSELFIINKEICGMSEAAASLKSGADIKNVAASTTWVHYKRSHNQVNRQKCCLSVDSKCSLFRAYIVKAVRVGTWRSKTAQAANKGKVVTLPSLQRKLRCLFIKTYVVLFLQCNVSVCSLWIHICDVFFYVELTLLTYF